MGALGSVLQKLFSPLGSRSAGRGCTEGRLLRTEWEQAAAPCPSMRLEVLDLYQERKAEARSILVSHRRTCPVCRGEMQGVHAGESQVREGYLEDESLDSDHHSLEHTKEAA